MEMIISNGMIILKVGRYWIKKVIGIISIWRLEKRRWIIFLLIRLIIIIDMLNLKSCYVMLIYKYMLFRNWIEMVYIINWLIMRNFDYKDKDYIKNEVVTELVEGNNCYKKYVYDYVMYDE